MESTLHITVYIVHADAESTPTLYELYTTHKPQPEQLDFHACLLDGERTAERKSADLSRWQPEMTVAAPRPALPPRSAGRRCRGGVGGEPWAGWKPAPAPPRRASRPKPPKTAPPANSGGFVPADRPLKLIRSAIFSPVQLDPGACRSRAQPRPAAPLPPTHDLATAAPAYPVDSLASQGRAAAQARSVTPLGGPAGWPRRPS